MSPAVGAGPDRVGVRGVGRRLRPVIELARPFRKDLRAAILSGVADQVLALSSGAVAAHLVGRGVAGASAFQMWPEAILLGFLIVPQVRMAWVEKIAATSVGYRIQVALREELFEAFARLSPAYMLRRHSGALGSVAISDVDVLQGFFAQTLPEMIVGITAPLVALITLSIVHLSLGLALAPFLAASAAVPWWLHVAAERQGESARAEEAETSSEIVDTIQGLRELLAFGGDRRRLKELEERAERYRTQRVAHARWWAAERAGAVLITTSGVLCAAALGVSLVRSGALALPMLPAVIVVAGLAFAPLARFHHAAKALAGVVTSGERVFALLAERPSIVEVTGERPPSIRPTIEFDRVSFRYGPELPLSLEGVSFEVAEGETVALVGSSGAGKSTCLNLLLRLFDPESGSVRIGGQDLRELPISTLRDLVAYVAQDTYLFNVTVADNIRLGRPDASEEAVREAAAAAIADEFIEALPEGYDTVVGERGVRLSGGERQRIAIACALLRNAPILVLDEPASSLDAENERAFRAAMSRLRQGRTTLVVAHRLSTIRSADRVVVLDRGRVVQIGTHEGLLASGGRYAELVASQMAG